MKTYLIYQQDKVEKQIPRGLLEPLEPMSKVHHVFNLTRPILCGSFGGLGSKS